MVPVKIEGATRNLSKPRNWDTQQDGACGDLWIKDGVDGRLCTMKSEWKPNAQEIALIVAGAPVQLEVVSNVHPPVSIGVGAVASAARD